jgi:hypothetical protein
METILIIAESVCMLINLIAGGVSYIKGKKKIGLLHIIIGGICAILINQHIQ